MNLRPDRPDALRAAVQLNVVIASTAHWAPAKDRLRRRKRYVRRLAQCQHFRQAGDADGLRPIPCLIDCPHGVEVLDAWPDLRVGERAAAPDEDPRLPLPAADCASDYDPV